MRTGRPGTLRRPSSFSNEAGREFGEGRAAGNSHFGCARFQLETDRGRETEPRHLYFRAGRAAARLIRRAAARRIRPAPARLIRRTGRKPARLICPAGRAPARLIRRAGRAYQSRPPGRISPGRPGVSVPARRAYQFRPPGVSVPAAGRISPGRRGAAVSVPAGGAYQSQPVGLRHPTPGAYQSWPGRGTDAWPPGRISPGRRD